MAEQQQLFRVDFLRTLWENTYRGTVFDCTDHYVASVRIILSIPLDRDELPEGAPEVLPAITVLVEDTILTPKDVLDFENVVSKIIIKKASSDTFHPDRCMFFYPSPAEAFDQQQAPQEAGKAN